MSEREDRSVPRERQDEPGDDATTGARGDGERENEATPPAGDVRTIYSDDRAPGEAEPDDQPS